MRVIFLAIFLITVGSLLTEIYGLANAWSYLERHQHFIYQISPLVFVKKGTTKVLLPQNALDKNGEAKLGSGEQVFLHCTGYNTHIAKNESEMLNVNVSPGEVKLKALKKFEATPVGQFPKLDIDSFRCLSPLFGAINVSNEPCGGGKGKWFYIGFRVIRDPKEKMQFNNRSGPPAQPPQKPMENLYRICFNEKTMSALYTVHLLRGTNLLFPADLFLREMNMVRASRESMNLRYPASAYYLENVQTGIFLRTFYIKDANYYLKFKDTRGRMFIPAPLTPPGDFYYRAVKSATYYFENSAPLFSSVYHGNLHVVEILGRILAVKYKSLEVTTGSYGILKLDGSPKAIYLDEEEINYNVKNYRPVPKYFYKIYYHRPTKSSIAFVTLNNPFLEDQVARFPCKKLIDDYMKLNIFKREPEFGITVACDALELIQSMKLFTGPDLTGGILKFDESQKDFLLKQVELPREIA